MQNKTDTTEKRPPSTSRFSELLLMETLCQLTHLILQQSQEVNVARIVGQPTGGVHVAAAITGPTAELISGPVSGAATAISVAAIVSVVPAVASAAAHRVVREAVCTAGTKTKRKIVITPGTNVKQPSSTRT